MRPILAALAAAGVLAGAALPAAAADIVVQIDHSTRVPLNGAAANVFVGNASIADAQIIDRHNLMVVGRGYGVTNLMVVDGRGRTLLNKQIMVSPGNEGRMTLYRAADANNFACSPTCERTAMPGEPGSGPPFDRFNAPYETYQKRASQGGSQSSAGGADALAAAAAVAAAAATAAASR